MADETFLTPETEHINKKLKRTPVLRNSIDIWAAQCNICYKWRKLPTQEVYEEIRQNILQDPFTCNKKMNVSCADLADLEYNNSCIWVFDKPNLPKTPPGFKRGLVLRKDYSRMDCYYWTPDGKKLRAKTDVATFLGNHPCNGVTLKDFSFTSPKIASDTIPQDVAGQLDKQNVFGNTSILTCFHRPMRMMPHWRISIVLQGWLTIRGVVSNVTVVCHAVLGYSEFGTYKPRGARLRVNY